MLVKRKAPATRFLTDEALIDTPSTPFSPILTPLTPRKIIKRAKSRADPQKLYFRNLKRKIMEKIDFESFGTGTQTQTQGSDSKVSEEDVQSPGFRARDRYAKRANVPKFGQFSLLRKHSFGFITPGMHNNLESRPRNGRGAVTRQESARR